MKKFNAIIQEMDEKPTRYVCTKCGMTGATTDPNKKEAPNCTKCNIPMEPKLDEEPK